MSAPYSIGTWFQLPLYVMGLGFDAQRLIALRLFRMAMGEVTVNADIDRIGLGRDTARAEAQRIVALSVATGQSDASPGKVVRPYRGRVKGNKKRPTKPALKRA